MHSRSLCSLCPCVEFRVRRGELIVAQVCMKGMFFFNPPVIQINEDLVSRMVMLYITVLQINVITVKLQFCNTFPPWAATYFFQQTIPNVTNTFQRCLQMWRPGTAPSNFVAETRLTHGRLEQRTWSLVDGRCPRHLSTIRPEQPDHPGEERKWVGMWAVLIQLWLRPVRANVWTK